MRRELSDMHPALDPCRQPVARADQVGEQTHVVRSLGEPRVFHRVDGEADPCVTAALGEADGYPVRDDA